MSSSASRPATATTVRPTRSKRGFALLITITLLAFLVLLLVSLASLTRVETQVASNNQQLAQARQNALMALNIALGQLQKYAGPDQRVTATADLVAGTSSGTRLTNGLTPNSATGKTLAPPATSTLADKSTKSKGLTSVRAGTRFWTGVWGNFDAPADIYQATPRPVFLNWLVSGNESRTFTADVAGGSPTGKITPSNNDIVAPFLPSLVISPALTPTTSATAALTIGVGATPAILLVGYNTAGTAARFIDAPTNTINENAVDRYVVAPLVDITAAPGSVPGSASTDTPVIGRYAYWIGDEGVKAKYNSKDPYSAKTDPYTDPTAHYRVATAQRSGLETMDGFTGYPVNNTTLDKVVFPLQVRMADTSLTLPDTQKHVHDYTTTSRGVLADTQNGGLRKDLTYLLSAPALSLSGQSIIPTTYSPKQVIGGVTTYCPTWNWLKSFKDLTNTGNLDYNKSGTTASVAVKAASATQTGVSPVISFVRMFIEANIIGDHVEFHTRLAVILGNPYPVSLTGSSLKIKFAADDYYYDRSLINNKQDSVCGIALYKNNSQLTFDGQTNVPKFPLFPAAAHNASATGITQSTKSLLGQINFTIPSINLPPGKQKIYSISSNQTGSIDSGSTTNITLSEGDTPNATYMITVVPSGASGWPAISTADLPSPPTPSPNTYTIRLTDSGNFSICLLDASDAVVTKHQHIDMIGDSRTEGKQDWTARDEATLSYKPLGGVDYYPIWPGQTPSAAEKGVQLFADYNLRAANIVMPKSSMPRGNGTGAYANGFHTRPPYYAAVRTVLDAPRDQFATGLTPTPPWGYDWKSGSIQDVVLFDVPRLDPDNDGGTLLSLGFLQHANLTADDENLNVGHQPGTAFGNSRFNPYVRQREVITGGATDSTNNNVYDAYVLQVDPSANVATPAPSTKTRFFDMSYLLNTALWDSYYFSTLPQNPALTATTGFTPGVSNLPNSRLTFAADYIPSKTDLGLNGGVGTDHYSAANTRTLPGESTPARYQMIEGAFNINSTSIQAWKSLLASLRTTYLKNSASSPSWSTAAPGLNAPFPRAVYPWANKSSLPTSSTAGQDPEDYAGFRDLTDAQLQTLAEKIVLQVRIRGPFLSLSHFINRSLHDTDTACLTGPLQAAIDANTATLNRPTDGSTFTGSGTTVYPTSPAQLTSVVPNRFTGLPGWFSQADILQALGPVVSARSDTFCIRVYGEVRDPLDSTAAPIARAWCEATVQRCPDYVDSADRPSETLGTLTSSNNKNFGRRFRVVSFRWLTPNDI